MSVYIFKSANLVMLGTLPESYRVLVSWLVKRTLVDRKPEILEMNHKALERGADYGSKLMNPANY